MTKSWITHHYYYKKPILQADFFFFFLPLPFSISLLIRISNRSEQWQKSEMQVHLHHLLGPVWGLGDEKVKTSDQKILGSSVIFASPQNASDSYR